MKEGGAAHGMCQVGGDKNATHELNISVDNYKGLQGLFVCGKRVVRHVGTQLNSLWIH